jgi:2-polyprenyl-6-methoxyphenol hydroxylase-like FAD-dependent oxidoreductase
MRVVVAGAGIGGLTAALSLAEAGAEVTVLESVREIRPLGVGINLQPHAVRELIELGLGEELAATGIATAEHVYTNARGTILFREQRGAEAGYRWPQYSIHRGELQLLLLEAVRERLGRAAVRTGVRVVDFRAGDDAVRVRLVDRADGVESELSADLLVGADGLHSAVRAGLHPGEGPLLWSGVRMYRGTAEAAPYLTGRSAVLALGVGGLGFIGYPISRRAADRGRALVNWVLQVPVAAPGPLAGEADWNSPANPAELMGLLDELGAARGFDGWREHWLDLPALIGSGGPILRFPMVDRDPLATEANGRSWGTGRVTLLGDAAHPMYPVGANGASQAIVDARVLAYHLVLTGALSGGRDALEAALAVYERERGEATAAVVAANRIMLRSDGAVSSVTAEYRKATGAEVERLNGRASLAPGK